MASTFKHGCVKHELHIDVGVFQKHEVLQKRYYTPDLELACFVGYVKIMKLLIINIFLVKNNIFILSYSKLFKELKTKSGIEVY